MEWIIEPQVIPPPTDGCGSFGDCTIFECNPNCHLCHVHL